MSRFSAFKKIFSSNKNENSTTSEEDSTTEETSPTSSSAAKSLVCQGAKCSCDKSETPKQIPLKVLSQTKYYINDSGGSQKLIASTMELPLPFDAPFFGKCTLKPTSSGNLPCQPVLTAWQEPYENVELANGGKILTEDSTALCAIGGTIKIEEHGQDPSQINETQVQNGTLAVASLLNPMIDQADIEILAGGTSDGDDIDDTGASVKKISTTDSKKNYLKEQWIHFKVDKWYNANANNKDKVNWVVYDINDNPVQSHQDIGETFDVRFSTYGTHKVEAYGGSAGGKKAATYTITIKEPEINSITKNVSAKIRPQETATFTLALDMKEALDIATISDIQWAVYKSTNGGKTYTEIVENTILGTTYIESATFTEKGRYLIKATWNEKTVEEKLRVGSNGVTAIKLDKSSMRSNNDTITFSVPKTSYSIVPPTEDEKQAVKWLVYDSSYTKIESLSGKTGETFEFSNHPDEGIYYVEAYMNTSEIHRIKQGKSSSCIKKVKVSNPEVEYIQWVDANGIYKTTCGYNEDIYAKIELKAFNNQKIKLKFYNIQKDRSKTVIAETQAVTVGNDGMVVYKMNFAKATYKDKITNGNEKGAGYVALEVLPFDEKDVLENGKLGFFFIPGTTLNIKSKEAVCRVYFERSGKRVRNVHFEETITCHIKTYNLIGKSVKINLYRYDTFLYIDHLNPDDKITSYNVSIDSQGLASFDICVEEKYNSFNSTREKFYLELEDVNWYSKAQQNQSTFIAFTKKDKLENQVNPVVVESAAGTTKKKKGRCDNCNKDITLEEIKGVCNIEEETGLQSAIDFLNSQRSFFGLTTCTRKAHFLGQLAAESKFTAMEEDFTYKWSALEGTFSNFNTDYDTNNINAKAWGYGHNNKTKDQVTLEDKRSICNWAYGKSPKASDLGNTPITSNWSNENADGWKYRGSGFIQLTGKSNFKSMSKLYNSWIATDGSGIDKLDLKENPDKLRTDKSIAIAIALIYWKNNNLLTRSDMGVGDDALGAITYRINNAFKGYAHRELYLEKAVKA